MSPGQRVLLPNGTEAPCQFRALLLLMKWCTQSSLPQTVLLPPTTMLQGQFDAHVGGHSLLAVPLRVGALYDERCEW